MVTLKQLQVFSAVARCGNLSQAAGQLYLSKGAVSQALAELERQLATPLFDRVHPHLKINQQGRALQPLAEDLLARANDIQHFFSGAPRGQLQIGASQTIGNYLLPGLLARSGLSQVNVSIHNSYELCQQLRQFELDLALIEGQNPFAELVTEPWLCDQMVVVAPPGHGLLDLPMPVTYPQLAEQHWVLREPQSGSREHFDQQLAPKLKKTVQSSQFNTLESVMQAVEAGLGVTLISELAVADRVAQGRLVMIALPAPIERQLWLCWHQHKYHTALMQQFVDYCRQQCPQA
ncbi:LysR substrate-binding domain-containing protein [Gallaecimonas sp. GXIMD1310]|uniref:LysR substrate-binding domain-containing protein n=1 Tax=Gallaecimonas sp. GXIMD1310 TaxID=3131926 RepID=UPI00324978EF